MTGQELFHALSFVDERYIAEAETAKLGARIPWVKVLSVAACLCILIVGAFALENIGHKGATEAAPEAAAPQAAPEAAPPEAAPESAAEEKIPAGELHHISYARLRVTNINEDGSFEAIVEETDADTNLFEKEMQATVVVDPTKVPGADAEVQNDLRILHTDAQIEIEGGAYDAGINTLYVAQIRFLCRDGQ